MNPETEFRPGLDELANHYKDILTLLGEDPELEKREMKLRQMIIGPESPFVGKTLEESGIRSQYSCMVVGLEEGKENLSPFHPARQFQEGDIIWIVGEQEALDTLLNS